MELYLQSKSFNFIMHTKVLKIYVRFIKHMMKIEMRIYSIKV